MRRYHIMVEVDHWSREQAIKTFEDLCFKLKVGEYKEDNVATTREYPFPSTITEVGQRPLSVLDRLNRIEKEIENRMGGLSEDAA
jgi:hypothetical protein